MATVLLCPSEDHSCRYSDHHQECFREKGERAYEGMQKASLCFHIIMNMKRPGAWNGPQIIQKLNKRSI